MSSYLFVGERPSPQAARIGATWQNGKLAAKQLHDALRAAGLDPQGQRYINLWTEPGLGPTAEPVNPAALEEIGRACGAGLTVVGMGQLVSRALAQAGIQHLTIVHPAARGLIRRKDRYSAHLAAALGLEAQR